MDLDTLDSKKTEELLNLSPFPNKKPIKKIAQKKKKPKKRRGSLASSDMHGYEMEAHAFTQSAPRARTRIS